MEDEAASIIREATVSQKLSKAIARGDSSIQQFYCGAVVLVTGAAGFMGKQLLEKLCRSCNIRIVYVLLRPRKEKTVKDRLDHILKDPAFESLHQSQPDFKQRIVPVDGDIATLRLGMTDQNWTDITENVTIIFHGAATVKFNETLKRAVLTNVRGTKEILHLAKNCKRLRSFVYISTAYSNATRNQMDVPILEQFYPVSVSPDVIIAMAEMTSEAKLEEMTDKITDRWPNTYSYTKALAEELVRTVGADLPVCVVRPAIVIGAYREPLPGWIDRRSVYGTSGIGFGLIMGILHVLFCDPSVAANMIPVDFVNNAIIAAGCATEKRWSDGQKEAMIYNVTCERWFIWADCIQNFKKRVIKIPSPKAAGICFAVPVKNKLAYYVLIYVMHYIPAYIIDSISILMGKKPWLTKIYNRIHKLTEILKYFTVNNWIFDDKNTQQLYVDLSKTDRFIYNFDKKTLDVPKMLVVWALGLRLYVLNDGLKGTDIGRKKQILFKLIGIGYLLVLCSCLIYFVKFLSDCFVNKSNSN